MTARVFHGAGYLLPLALWWASARLLNIPLVLPAPGLVLRDVAEILVSRDFLGEIGATTFRAIAALGGSMLVAVPLGMVAGRSTKVDALLAPSVLFVRAVPFISLILIAVVWFTSGTVPVFVAVLMVFPILYEGGRTGVRSVDPGLAEMMALFRCTRLVRILHLWIPGAMSTILGSLRSAAGIAWKVTVAAEVLSVPRRGIGTRMGEARLYLEMERVLAWTLGIIVLAGVTDRLITFIEEGLPEIRAFWRRCRERVGRAFATRREGLRNQEPQRPHGGTGSSLSLSRVTFTWPQHTAGSPPVFQEFDFVVPGGSVTAVIGPSGVGKTTLLALLAGVIVPQAGSIGRSERDSRPPGMVFQEPRLLPWRTAYENVSIVGAGGANDVLHMVHLDGVGDSYPDQLSGGMRQRLNLARALHYGSGVLLIDEPLSGVDQAHRSELSAMLGDVIRAQGLTTIISSHDLDLVYAVADRIVLLEEQPAVIALDIVRGGKGWDDEARRQVKERLESSRHTLRRADTGIR